MENRVPRIYHLIDHNGLGGAQMVLKTVQENSNDKVSIGSLSTVSESNTVITSIEYRGFGKSIVGLFRNIKGVDQWILNDSSTILHCHLLYSRIIGLWYKLRHPKVHLVYHEHGEIWKARLLYRITNALSRPFLSATIALNEPTKMKIGRDEIKVLPNPIYGEGGPISRPTDRKFTIGFAGRIKALKGWRRFLEIAKSLNEGFPNEYGFLLAGSGPEEEELNNFLDSEPELPIRWIGQVSDMDSFYNQIDLLVMPSHFEAGGLVHLEAQLRSVPVVMTDLAGPKSTLIEPDSAVLVSDKDSADKWANVIAELISNPEKLSSLQKSGLRNAQHYGVENYLYKLNMFYKDLVLND